MMRNIKPKRAAIWVLAAIIPAAACSQGPSPEVQARIDSLQTTRDSLTRELAEQNEYVQQLSRRIEEAVGAAGGSVTPEQLGDQITTLRDELESARARATQTQQRVGTLNRQVSTLRDSLNTVVSRSGEALAAHRDSIDALLGSLQSMDADMEELQAERASLEETLSGLEEEYFTVYVAVGTKDELIEGGVLEEEGGARILLVLWRAGETLVPSRDLDPSGMQAIDFRQTSTIELPGPGSYRVVSRHDLDYLEPAPDQDGRFTGSSLTITEPRAFWRYSPYLIVVAED